MGEETQKFVAAGHSACTMPERPRMQIHWMRIEACHLEFRVYGLIQDLGVGI